jgi:3-oxoadipate enol-lactonase
MPVLNHDGADLFYQVEGNGPPLLLIMTPEEATEVIIPFVYAPGTPRADIDADLAVRAAHPTDPVGYMAQLTDAIVWRGSLDRLPGLAIPALLVHGDLDRLVPIENSRRMAAALPSARLEVLAGASHIFVTDQPQRTRAVLESFLNQDQ